MSLWKILGGATFGIAAAPFTGGASLLGVAAVGTGTLIGSAVVATAAGVAIGSKLSDLGNEEVLKKEKASWEKKKGSSNIKIEKLKNSLEQAINKIKSYEEDKEYWKFLIATVAVGMATAKVDGKISKEELEQIDEFIGGLGKEGLPKNIQNKLDSLRYNPPTFNTAINLVHQLNKKYRNYEFFEHVIEVVGESDGNYDANEKAFLEAFKSQRIA